MCKWIQIFLASIILLISCTQESGGGSQDDPNDNNQTKTELATLQDIVDNANAGETINLADYTDLTDYNAVINKSLTITNGSLNNAELTVTSENVKLDSLSDLSVKSLSKLTINDSKLNDLLLGTGEVSRSAAVTSSAMAMASVTSCEIRNVKMLGFNSQLNITDIFTKITNIATSTKCKIVLEKGSYIDMKDPKVTGSGELVRIDMTKDMELSVLSIYQNPNKIEYNVGENFDKSGLIVMGTYFASVEIFKNGWNGEVKESVTKWEDEKDYEISVPDLSTAGVKIVEITSNINVKCYFHIFVKSDDSTAAAITVSNVNVMSGKINYKVGEMLDLSGFRVIGNYNDFEINLPYTSKPADGTVLNEAGNKEVTFYYYIGDTTGSVKAKISVTAEEDSSEQQPTGETFTITFNANDGSGEMKAQTAKKGEKITLTANTFTKTGYTFSGWATSADGNGSKYEDKSQITLTNNITLYAQWTIKVEKVTFLINGIKQDNTTNTISVDNGDKVTLSCGTDGATIYYAEVTDIPPTLSEILLSKQEYSEPIAITENVTIAAIAVKGGMTDSEPTYATFTVKTYTVTFDANGHGTAPKEISGLKKGDKLTKEQLKEPENVIGYTFGGWYYGENNEFTAGTEITSNVTLTAEWTPKTGTVYKVEHYQQNIEDDNYTLAKIEPMTGTTDEETAAEAEEATGFNAKEFAQVKIAANGSTVVKIYYDRKMVKLTLNCDNGTEPQTVTEKFGAYVKVDVPTKTGYTFASWNPQLPATFPAKDAQYTATWNAISYEIKYELGDGENVNDNPTNYTIETETITLKAATRTGYVFDGWYEESSFTTKVTKIAKGATGNITLYANWTEITADNVADVINALSDTDTTYTIAVNGEISNNTLTNINAAIKNKTKAKFIIDLNNTMGISTFNSTFSENKKLIEIILPSSVTTISYYAFNECSNLTKITIPNDVTKIGFNAFSYCNNLTSITIPNKVTYIDNYTFYECSSLRSIIIPNGVTEIGNHAFDSCKTLDSITIPTSLTKIGYNAFNGCSSLTTVNYKGTEEQWGNIEIDKSNNTYLGNSDIFYNYTGE